MATGWGRGTLGVSPGAKPCGCPRAVAQLATPLDFAAITDHAEGFDRIGICTDPDHAMYATQACEDMRNPKVDIDEFFARALAQAVRWPRPRSPALCADLDACPVAARATWRRTQTAADAFDRPGEFTAPIGYEFTGMLPGAGMLHRNVLFRNGHVAEDAISSNDVVNQSDFFGQLDAACQPPCEVLTIPHNTNFSWGLMFAGADWDGGEYTEADLERRLRIDRVVEVTRRKGSSECQVGVGATDEDLPADLGAWSDPLETAYAGGVPMGGDLEGEDPRTFWAWAAQDPDAATLCGVLGRAPTRRGWALRTLTATVDTATCERHDDPGAAELEATFTDPAFRPDQHASTMSA